MDRRQFVAGVAAISGLSGIAPGAFAQAAGAPEKAKVTLGVGGKPLLYYLPLTIAERRGFFKEEGLEVEINDFGGGAKSLQALIGGSVDVVTGAYEHTIRMQAKGQEIQAVCELGRFPAIVIAVKTEKAGEIKSIADLKGRKIGVTAPGSSTAITAQYAMVKAGLRPTDAAFIGIGGGAGAVAAMQKGEIDVISHLDPVIAKLEEDGPDQGLVDTRTEQGTKDLFGASNPAAVVYLKRDFIAANPNTTQRPRERTHESAEMDRERHAGDSGGQRALRVPPRRQAPLPQGREELAPDLFARRDQPEGGPGERARHAPQARPGTRRTRRSTLRRRSRSAS
jgi:NitT/TauT family transport system substrate-binding protein